MMYAALMAAAQGAVETCTGDSLSARQLLEQDIHCSVTGRYIGAYDRNYSLTIDGPKEKKWEYRFAVAPEFTSLDEQPVQMEGTYEFMDDLVVFSGHRNKGIEIRFALNYGKILGRVYFNAFLPVSDTKLQYHRRWFKKKNGSWSPAEELTLSLARINEKELVEKCPPPATAEEIRQTKQTAIPRRHEGQCSKPLFLMEGERITWDQHGEMKREKYQTNVYISKQAGVGPWEIERATNGPFPDLYYVRLLDPRWNLDGVDSLDNTRACLRGFYASISDDGARW
jgi:hypothetical protein